MDVDELVAKFRQFFRPCYSTEDTSARDEALKLAHTLKTLLREDFIEAIVSHADDPVCVSYQHDGWGAVVRQQKKLKVSDFSGNNTLYTL